MVENTLSIREFSMLYDFTTDFSGTFRCEALDDESAKILANEYFEDGFKEYGQTLPSGRWVLANEGEDADGTISYIHYRYETPLRVVYFCADRRYPEDNKIIGVYSSDEKCERGIEERMTADKKSYPDYPGRAQKKRSHYEIHEFYLDETISS